MKYIQIKASTHAEALKQLRDTYGSEAIIFGDKEIPASENPKSSLKDRVLGKKHFLIEAAIKEKSTPNNNSIKTSEQSNSKYNNLEKLIIQTNNVANTIESSQKKNNIELKSESQNFLNEIQKHLPKSINLDLNKKDINNPTIKSDIEFIKDGMGSLNYKKPSSEDMSFLEMGKSELAYLSSELLIQDFSQKWVTAFIKQLHNTLSPNEIKNEMIVREKAFNLISSKIKNKNNFGKRCIALIGTTGVGKTTTIAKIAAQLKIEKNKSVALVTMDNYRIAATEQLKVYANILDVPIYICKDQNQLKNICLEEYADYILIDTAGVSHRNEDIMNRQKNCLDILDRDVEKHLVLSATSKVADVKNIVESFNKMKFERIIISKIDETHTYGHLVELAEIWDKDFSFFCTGQNVPEDYMEANSNFLTNKILKLK